MLASPFHFPRGTMVRLPWINGALSESPRKGATSTQKIQFGERRLRADLDTDTLHHLTVDQKRLVNKSFQTHNFEVKVKRKDWGDHQPVSPAEVIQQALRSHAANVSALHLNNLPNGGPFGCRRPKRSLGRLQYENPRHIPSLDMDPGDLDTDDQQSGDVQAPPPTRPPPCKITDADVTPLPPSTACISPRGQYTRSSKALQPSRAVSHATVPGATLPPVAANGGPGPDADTGYTGYVSSSGGGGGGGGVAGSVGGLAPAVVNLTGDKATGGLRRSNSTIITTDQVMAALRGGGSGVASGAAALATPLGGLPHIAQQPATKQGPNAGGLRMPLAGAFRSSPNSPDMYRRRGGASGGGAALPRPQQQQPPLAHAVAAVTAAQDYLQHSSVSASTMAARRAASPPKPLTLAIPVAAAAAAAAASIPLPQMALSPRSRMFPLARALTGADAAEDLDPAVERSAPNFSFGALRHLADVSVSGATTASGGNGAGAGTGDGRSLKALSVGNVPRRSRPSCGMSCTDNGGVGADGKRSAATAATAAAPRAGGGGKGGSGAAGGSRASAFGSGGAKVIGLSGALPPAAEELFTRVSRSIIRAAKPQEWVPTWNLPVRSPSVFSAASCGVSPYVTLSAGHTTGGDMVMAGAGQGQLAVGETVTAAAAAADARTRAGGSGSGTAAAGCPLGLRLPLAGLALPGDASPLTMSPRGGVRLPPLADGAPGSADPETPCKPRFRPSFSWSTADGTRLHTQLEAEGLSPAASPHPASPFAEQSQLPWRSALDQLPPGASPFPSCGADSNPLESRISRTRAAGFASGGGGAYGTRDSDLLLLEPALSSPKASPPPGAAPGGGRPGRRRIGGASTAAGGRRRVSSISDDGRGGRCGGGGTAADCRSSGGGPYVPPHPQRGGRPPSRVVVVQDWAEVGSGQSRDADGECTDADDEGDPRRREDARSVVARMRQVLGSLLTRSSMPC